MATANLSAAIHTSLTNAECVGVISDVSQFITVLVSGEPGTGKTSMQHALAAKHSSHQPIYADMANMDVGDVMMRIPNHATGRLDPYVSSLFGLDDPRPKLLMLDEIGKMPRIIQPTVTRLMLERTIGDVKLPDGSMVWATTNNASDGLGDTIPAHTGDRMMKIKYAKPNAELTNLHFTEAGASTLLRGWIAMHPHALHSYETDDLTNNDMPFNPAKRQHAFVTQRGLFRADKHVIQTMNRRPVHVTQAMLAGMLGESAARSMVNFFQMAKDLQPVAKVFKDPHGTTMPEKDAALFLMCFNALDALTTQDELSAFMQYIERKHSDVFTALFNTMALGTKRTAKLARNNPLLLQWMKIPGNYQLAQ